MKNPASSGFVYKDQLEPIDLYPRNNRSNLPVEAKPKLYDLALAKNALFGLVEFGLPRKADLGSFILKPPGVGTDWILAFELRSMRL